MIFENLFLHVHPVKVREKTLRFSHTYWLGGITLVCSLVLIATGILLMFYYHPSVPQAYRDMKELEFVVDNGLFLRNLHRWAAHLMVFAAFSTCCASSTTGPTVRRGSSTGSSASCSSS